MPYLCFALHIWFIFAPAKAVWATKSIAAVFSADAKPPPKGPAAGRIQNAKTVSFTPAQNKTNLCPNLGEFWAKASPPFVFLANGNPNGLIIKSFFSLVNEMELGVLFRAKRPVFMVFYRRIQRSGFAFPRCLFSFFYRLSMGLLARLFHRNFMRKVSCFCCFP